MRPSSPGKRGALVDVSGTGELRRRGTKRLLTYNVGQAANAGFQHEKPRSPALQRGSPRAPGSYQAANTGVDIRHFG